MTSVRLDNRTPLASRRIGARTAFALVAGATSLAGTADNASDERSLHRLEWTYTTKAYRDAALQVLLQEASAVARRMKLPERLPITAGDLVESFISSPFESEHGGSMGSIATSNYTYNAIVDNRLSAVVRNFGPADEGESAFMGSVRRRYTSPNALMDTNTAYVMSTQFLAAAGVDVAALERDCKVTVAAWERKTWFVPVYTVRWLRPQTSAERVTRAEDGLEPAAMVQVLAPERRLLQMSVLQGRYLTGTRPLEVADKYRLLQQTEDPKMREVWFTSSAYRKAALEVMLNEANRICQELQLAEQLPIQAADVKEAIIETPFFYDHLGRLALLRTKNFVYSTDGGKLNWIARNNKLHDETGYLMQLKNRYLAPKSGMQTNTAYVMATQWLAAASVDVAALERDSRPVVQAWDWDLGRNFVPLYQVSWVRGDGPSQEKTAVVKLLEPEKQLLKFYVMPHYLKRPPLTVPNRQKLLLATNDVAADRSRPPP